MNLYCSLFPSLPAPIFMQIASRYIVLMTGTHTYHRGIVQCIVRETHTHVLTLLHPLSLCSGHRPGSSPPKVEQDLKVQEVPQTRQDDRSTPPYRRRSPSSNSPSGRASLRRRSTTHWRPSPSPPSPIARAGHSPSDPPPPPPPVPRPPPSAPRAPRSTPPSFDSPPGWPSLLP